MSPKNINLVEYTKVVSTNVFFVPMNPIMGRAKKTDKMDATKVIDVVVPVKITISRNLITLT